MASRLPIYVSDLGGSDTLEFHPNDGELISDLLCRVVTELNVDTARFQLNLISGAEVLEDSQPLESPEYDPLETNKFQMAPPCPRIKDIEQLWQKST